MVAALIVGLCGGAGALFLFFILPSARIVVTPALHEKEAEQTIVLSAATQEPDFKKFVLPARVVEAEGSETVTVERTDGTPRPSKATGTVRLHNEQDEEQPLLPQTTLRHEATGTLFLTNNAVRIPVRGEVTVGITAKEEGVKGNVPAGKFIVDKLPPSLQEVVWAESGTATAGGEIFDTPLSEAELSEAKEKILQAARAEARGTLGAAASGATLRDDLIAETIEEHTASAEPGSQASTYNTSARVRLRTFVVDDTAVLSLTLLALQSQTAAGEEFVSYDPTSFTMRFQRADFDRGEARVTGKLKGSFAEKTESKIFDAGTLAGRTPAEVQEYFKQFPSVADVQVALSPFWVTTVPSRPSAVEVVIEKK